MYAPEPHLLITDDDSAFRLTVRSVFEDRGFRTFEASDGGQAVEIVNEREIHLVLMDMHMPRVSGIEAMRQLKRVNSAIPCILISAGLDDQIVEQAEAIPVFSILPKPVSIRELTNTVVSALNENYRWQL